MKPKSFLKIVLIFFLVSSGFFLIINIFAKKDLYTRRFDPKLFEKKYLESQWVVSGSKHLISDETLYAFAGYRYINGTNPILINSEVPPLGKYLIGLSIVLFKNENYMSVIFSVLSLAVLFILVYIVSSSIPGASLAVFLTSTHTVFIDQIIHTPQLDIYQLFFLLLFLLFFIMFQKKYKWKFLILAGIFFGGFISVKFFLWYYSMLNISLIIFYLLKKFPFKRMLTEIIILNVFAFIIYLLSYFQYFLQGGTLRSFLGVQKWIALFYAQSQIDMTNIIGRSLTFIFMNRWRFWSEGYPLMSYKYWTIFWPVLYVGGFYIGYKIIKKFRNQTEFDTGSFLLIFLVIYNVFLFFTPMYPRYMLLLFVPLNILIGLYLGKIIERKF